MKNLRCTPFLILLLMVVLIMPSGLHGQAGMGGGASNRIDGKTKFMPIPYLNYDRSMGLTLGAVPMLMFNPSKKDTLSPSSLLGGVGTYSTNKTWFMMGFGMFFLDGLVGSWIPYRSDATFFMFKVERRIYKQLYGGMSYVFADVVSSSEEFPISDSVTNHGIGLSLSLDRCDNPHYPRKGHLSTIKYNTFPEFFGNETVTQKIDISSNHNFSARRNKDVVAAQAYAGLGLGETWLSVSSSS